MNIHTSKLVALGLTAVLLGGATACGDDADADAPAPTTLPAVDQGGHAGHAEVVINGVDYAFDNVPDTVPAGTKLDFRNSSATELHEMVVFRLPADVDAPLAELITRPDLEAVLGAPVTVMLQPPGASEPIVAVGDGTLAESGRYAVMCFIPIGADPQEYLDAVAAAGGNKPEGVAGGPPHFTAGMYAEITVE